MAVYAFEPCPFRNVTHAAADRIPGLRPLARATWPAARRAERVELTDAGVAASGLTGATTITWGSITAAGSGCQAALDAEWYLRDTPQVPTPEGMPEGDLAEAQYAAPQE